MEMWPQTPGAMQCMANGALEQYVLLADSYAPLAKLGCLLGLGRFALSLKLAFILLTFDS
jgi:hypothetical protein